MWDLSIYNNEKFKQQKVQQRLFFSIFIVSKVDFDHSKTSSQHNKVVFLYFFQPIAYTILDYYIALVHFGEHNHQVLQYLIHISRWKVFCNG